MDVQDNGIHTDLVINIREERNTGESPRASSISSKPGFLSIDTFSLFLSFN
jgi:hypothetical protein